MPFGFGRRAEASKSPQLLLDYWPGPKGMASRQATSAQLIAYFSGQRQLRSSKGESLAEHLAPLHSLATIECTHFEFVVNTEAHF